MDGAETKEDNLTSDLVQKVSTKICIYIKTLRQHENEDGGRSLIKLFRR